MFSKEVKPDDWKTKSGYRCRIMSKAEKEAQDMQGIQKLNAVMASMPDNQLLQEIYHKNLPEFADLKQDEIKQVMDFEKQKREAFPNQSPLLSGEVQNGILPQLQP